MIKAEEFIRECCRRGFAFFTGMPSSYLTSFIHYIADCKDVHYVDATNEGDAVAMAAGATLGGKRSVIMFQNSGLGNAMNPLTSLVHTFRLPMLIITTLSDDPSGFGDGSEHELMGAITIPLLEILQLPWAYFPTGRSEIPAALDRACREMEESQKSFVLVMKEDCVEPYQLTPRVSPEPRPISLAHTDTFSLPCDRRFARTQALQVIKSTLRNQVPLIASAGKASGELYELEDRPNHFYMVGPMGCALPLGLGVALQIPQSKVAVIDGDGALLKRMGTMATVGGYGPKNLLHILLDNEALDSSGGQSIVGRSVSFATVAKGLHYRHCYSTDQLEFFQDYLQNSLYQEGPTFIHFKIRKGAPKALGRPRISPVEVAQRFSQFLQSL